MLSRGMIVAVAMAAMLAAPGVAQAQCANADAPFTSISASAAADALACLANEERAGAGKRTLSRKGKLQRIATGHADYVGSSGNVSHIDDEGDNPSDRATGVGYNWKAVGENLGIGSTPSEVIGRWMDDSAHRRILLRSKYRDYGSGAAAYDSDGNAVFCLVLGVRK